MSCPDGFPRIYLAPPREPDPEGQDSWRSAPKPRYDWRAGDVLLFWGRSWKSRIIELVTCGPSHVGLIADAPDGSRLLLWESTTLCDLPDCIDRQHRQGVQAQDPDQRVATYDGRVARMRLAPLWHLDSLERDLLRRMTGHLHGEDYDLAGALLAGTRVFKWTRCMPYPDLGSLFCSEMVAALLMRLGRLPLGHPGRYSPASLARHLRTCGTYEALTPIAPAAARAPAPAAHGRPA
jgi:hypothetical protein